MFGQTPTPWYLAHRELLTAQTAGTSARSANTTYLHEVDNPAPCAVTGFSIARGGISAGNFDLGIYDSAGNLLVHTGVTPAGAINTLQTVNLSTPFALAAGRYYLALWVDNALDTYFARAGATPVGAWGNIMGSTGTNLGGLASNFAGMGGTNAIATFVPFVAHISGTGF